jgi:hypothetical protein
MFLQLTARQKAGTSSYFSFTADKIMRRLTKAVNTEKLKILINHLKGHNEDHAKEIIELAQKAKKLGHDEVHDLLLKSAEELRVSNISLEKAEKLLAKER